ncbi:hypothetical protein ACU4GD_03930 [Cupriavidus basilensis]
MLAHARAALAPFKVPKRIVLRGGPAAQHRRQAAQAATAGGLRQLVRRLSPGAVRPGVGQIAPGGVAGCTAPATPPVESLRHGISRQPRRQ